MTLFRSFVRWFAPLAVVLAAALSAPVARAQIVELAAPIPATDDLATVFEKGSRLEGERKWAEALMFYEEALRQHPTRTDLAQRITLARAHYDVSRRYGDASFTAAVDQLRDREALAIYDEVLIKIQSNFVHQPNWQQILYSGLTNLEVALSEPAFAEKNLTRVAGDQLGNLAREIRQLATSRRVADRAQAVAHVDSIGRKLDERYGLSSRAVVMEFASGATAALDEYSGFLTGGQMDEVFSQIEGNFVGLGIELRTEPAGLFIVNVIPTGPAAQGGIRPGDRIVEVDRKTTADSSPDCAARRGARSRLSCRTVTANRAPCG
jgi:carboxyl-terminal processing protease